MAQETLALPGVTSDGGIKLVNYRLRGGVDKDGVEYVGVNDDDSLSAPRIIDVKQEIKNPGVTTNDRNIVTFKQTVLDENNVPYTGSVSIKTSIPRCKEWTEDLTVSLGRQAASYRFGQHAAEQGETNTGGFPVLWAEMVTP